MSSLSLSFLGVKNEAYLNEARKCIYKAIIYLEEIVSGLVDAPFSDYEAGLETISAFSDESRYNLVRKMGFTIDSLEEGFGENSKWKWSFVELEGRFAAVAKNLLNLKTFVGGHGSPLGGVLGPHGAPWRLQGAAAAGGGPLPGEVRAFHDAHRRHQGGHQFPLRRAAAAHRCWENRTRPTWSRRRRRSGVRRWKMI